MNVSRTIFALAIVAVCLTPLYGHHGNQFLSKAMEANTAEVKLAEMASTKAQNQKVKDFAQMLAKDHSETLNKIRSLRDARVADATGKGQVAAKTADEPLTAEHQRTADKLQSLSGANFDREFINVMVMEHRSAIRDFEAQTHVHGNAISSTNKANAPGQAGRQKPANPDQKTYSRSDIRRDVDTAEFAAATLPTLRSHLMQAESLQRQLQAPAK